MKRLAFIIGALALLAVSGGCVAARPLPGGISLPFVIAPSPQVKIDGGVESGAVISVDGKVVAGVALPPPPPSSYDPHYRERDVTFGPHWEWGTGGSYRFPRNPVKIDFEGPGVDAKGFPVIVSGKK